MAFPGVLGSIRREKMADQCNQKDKPTWSRQLDKTIANEDGAITIVRCSLLRVFVSACRIGLIMGQMKHLGGHKSPRQHTEVQTPHWYCPMFQLP